MLLGMIGPPRQQRARSRRGLLAGLFGDSQHAHLEALVYSVQPMPAMEPFFLRVLTNRSRPPHAQCRKQHRVVQVLRIGCGPKRVASEERGSGHQGLNGIAGQGIPTKGQE